MGKCRLCSGDSELSYTCKLCGGVYCGSHRLPESHECPGLDGYQSAPSNTDRSETWTRHTEGVDPGEEVTPVESHELSELPGTPVEEELNRSPDTAPDGSLIDETDAGRADEASRKGSVAGRQLWPKLDLYRSRPSAAIVDIIWMLGLVAVTAAMLYGVVRFLT